MSHKSIPFSAADRATIRSTSLWMTISGGLMALCGGYMLVRVAQLAASVGAAVFEVFLMPSLVGAAQLALGVLLLVGSRAFVEVAASGRIAALNRGFSALTIIYVFQAIVMLVLLALFILSFMLPMLH